MITLTIFQRLCLKKKPVLAASLLLLATQPAFAGNGPAASLFSNPLAITLLLLMTILLIIIAVLANVLLGAADWKTRKKDKTIDKPIFPLFLLLFFLLPGSSLFAQDKSATVEATVSTIGGLSAGAFYTMASVIFLELFIIIALLINIKFLIKTEKEKAIPAEEREKKKKPAFVWWNKINKFKPVEQEADIDLGHDYDGIRELDNRLPPWWLWGFYITIIMAAVYLWRYHVSETAPLSIQEYEESVATAELKIQEYLKQKGESVNENTVTFLSDANDIAVGKTLYLGSCVACHKDHGGGDVGPNLTDDYWLHGGDIKSIFKTIKYGVDGKGMASWQSVYSAKEIAQISSFVKSLQGTNPPNPKAAQGDLYKEQAPAEKPVADSVAVANEKKTVLNR